MRTAGLRRLGIALVGAVAMAAIVFGSLTVFTEVEARGRCICPKVYAPVVCDNGKTYSNLCLANCKNATGCVPVPLLPPPI